MKQKITDLKVKQVPCKKKGFREFKITYKYKGKEISDFKAFDDELYKNKSKHELYREVVRETNKRKADGKLARYAFKFLHPKFIPLAIACASVALVSAAVIPTAVVLSKENKPINYLLEPLTITCESNNLKLILRKTAESDPINLERSFDKKNWENITIGSSSGNYNIAALTKGKKVYLRGENPDGFSSASVYHIFSAEPGVEGQQFSASGNIMSLLSAEHYKTLKTLPSDSCFNYTFAKANSLNCLIDAKNLILPALKVGADQYNFMFWHQNFLENGPLIMAEELSTSGDHCNDMFCGCTNIKSLNVNFTDDVWVKNPSATKGWCGFSGGGFSGNGTFYWRGPEKYDNRSADTIPEGWKIVHKD